MNADHESFYESILEECIAFLEEVTQTEEKKICSEMEIGKRIDRLVGEGENDDAVIKRLARDIAKMRGKIILTSKLYEYRQLYLNFRNIETIRRIAANSLTDISTGMLLGLTGGSKEAGDEDTTNKNDFVSPLIKVLKLLTGFTAKIEDRELSKKELSEVAKNLESIRDKTDSILHVVQNYEGRCQMDLFKGGSIVDNRSC